MSVVRVFPRRTSATPTDELAFVGEPPLPDFLPPADEVHVSVTFTWDVERGKRLASAWDRFYPGKVRIGGPAMGNIARDFIPGRYLREGYTITSRGCPNSCPWCLVPARECSLELYPIPAGHIVQDNNLLACSELHWWRVLAMLAGQRKGAVFAGGLEARLFTEQRAFELYSNIRVGELWFAYDHPARWDDVRLAIRTAVYWFGNGKDVPQDKVRCYVLAGYGDDSPAAAETRCWQVMEAGGLPYLMLWQPADRFIDYRKTSWRPMIRTWQRACAMKVLWANWHGVGK